MSSEASQYLCEHYNPSIAGGCWEKRKGRCPHAVPHSKNYGCSGGAYGFPCPRRGEGEECGCQPTKKKEESSEL